MSFYRKYRPQKLSEVVGQNHVKQTFLNALKKGGVTHAYLFAGSRGTGKTSVARIIARALNCLNPSKDGEPCNECEICADALENRLVDLIEIDAASNRGIDEIRDLKEKIQFSPSRAKSKIYVIDEVHMLTKEAFNALLKTLEEPPAHAYFILATTEPHKVPETIISRTQRFDFHRIEEAEIANHLKAVAEKEGIKFEEEALKLIARQSSGGMRDALGMLEQMGASGEVRVEEVAKNLGLTKPKAVEDFVFALIFQKLSEALETINGLVNEGVNLLQFNKAALAKLREIMLEKVSENKLGEAKRILTIIEEFTRANEELKSAVIPQLPLESAVVEVCSGEIQSEKPEAKNNEAIPKKKVNEPKKVEIKEEKEVKKIVEEKIEARSDGEISVQVVEATLPKILGELKNSTIKTILRDAKIIDAEKGEITLGVGSDFLLEKLDNAEALNLLTKSFSENLGRDLKIKVKRAEIEIQPTTPPEKVALSKPNLAQAAEELFEEGW